MAKFIILLVSLAVIQTSLALKCKSCSNECDNVSDVDCPMPSSSQQVACLKEVYLDASKKHMTDKKCVLLDKNKKYECVNVPGTEQVSCQTCDDKDFCNSAPAVAGFSLALILSVLAAFFVPSLY